VDVYELPQQQQSTSGPSALDTEDGAADDRIAEEFRREFMDAMQQRHQKRRPAQQARGSTSRKDDPDVLKGPKLGGSRNTRSAIRDILLKKGKEGKR
jgi:hypothetical protein